MARLLPIHCFVVFIAMVVSVDSTTTTPKAYYIRSTRPMVQTALTTRKTTPVNYPSTTRPTVQSSSTTRKTTTANYPSTTKAFSNNLLMKILLNLGHNAEAVNMLATNLDEEAKIAADIAKQ